MSTERWKSKMESFKNREPRNKWDHRYYLIMLFVLCVGLNLSGFLRAELLSPAKRSAYDQITWQRANSVDCGDFYYTPDGEKKLYRLAGAIAVNFEENADKEAVLDTLTASNGLLSEYAFEVNDYGQIAILKTQPPKKSHIFTHATVVTDLAETALHLPGIRVTSPVFIDPETGLWMIPTGEIIVQFKEEIHPETVLGDREIHRPPATERQFMLTLRGVTSTDVFTEVNELIEHPDVEWLAPNFLMQGLVNSVNDTYYNQQWHLNNTGQTNGTIDADVDASEAWTITTGSPDIVIAVLDSGVETHHPDLHPNLFVNSGDNDSDGIDDDSNGYIDDIQGWDFYPDIPTPYGNNDPNPKTEFDNHGTNVAGVTAARGNNDIGVAGVAYTSRLLPIRIGEQTSETSIQVYTNHAAAAILYAAGINNIGQRTWDGADILSMSLTLGNDPQIQNALTLAATKGRNGKGCPIFCSVGNEASGYSRKTVGQITGFPGRWSWVVTYEKDDSTNAGEDTVWMAEFQNADKSIHRFDSINPPTGWYLDPFEGERGWFIENDPTHAYGTSRYHVRPERIRHGQKAFIMAPAFDISGDIIPGIGFQLWRSCEINDTVSVYLFNHDNSRLYNIGTLDGAVENGEPLVHFPASHPDTIAVGSSTDFDYRANYSRYGDGLDFVAPSGGGAQGLYTTDRTDRSGYDAGDYTSSFSGTSASTPLAAGVAALILSTNPVLSASEVRQIMRESCDQIGRVTYDENNWSPYYGYGRINAKKALDAVPTTPTTPSQATNPSPSHDATCYSKTVSLNWSGGDGATSYDVYFGTDSTPDSGEFKRNQSGRTYNPGILQYNTTYYWRIDAKNSRVTTAGDVWKFTTELVAPRL